MSRGNSKRNDFQRADDRILAIDMLKSGHTLSQIAAHISEIRPYSLSLQQVAADVRGLRLAALAGTVQHMAEVIDRELLEIDKTLVEIDRLVQVKPEKITTNESGTSAKIGAYQKTKEQWINLTYPVALLNIRLAAVARRSTLMGLDSHLKYLDTNAAIESLTSKGYEVSDPSSDEGETDQAEIV